MTNPSTISSIHFSNRQQSDPASGLGQNVGHVPNRLAPDSIHRVSPERQSSRIKVLNSWKEISTYLGRGVRTVQRYEVELGLPVRRPHGKSRSAVIAIPDELDTWLRSCPCTTNGAGKTTERPTLLRESIAESRKLREQSAILASCHKQVAAGFITVLRKILESSDTKPRLNTMA